MTDKSFYNPRRSPRGINLLAFGALIVITFAAARLGADSVPDWVSAAAHESLPPLVKDPVAAILLDEQITTVRDSGEIDTLYRRVCKILRPEGRERFGRVFVDFDKDTKLSSLKGWTLPINGKDYEVKEKDAIETSLFNDSLYSDMRAKLLELPAPTPGNIVAYEYVQKQRPYIFDDAWDFQTTVPVRRSRFILQLPPGWEVKTQWVNHPDVQETKSGGNSYTWELENVPAIEPEPEMPPYRVIAGRMGVKYFPSGTSAIRTSGSWKDIGLWYSSLNVNSRQASPRSNKKSSSLPQICLPLSIKSKLSPILCSAKFATWLLKSALAEFKLILPPRFSSTSTAIAKTRPLCSVPCSTRSALNPIMLSLKSIAASSVPTSLLPLPLIT